MQIHLSHQLLHTHTIAFVEPLLANFFSKRAISRFAAEIQIRASTLSSRINSEFGEKNKVMNLGWAFGWGRCDGVLLRAGL